VDTSLVDTLFPRYSGSHYSGFCVIADALPYLNYFTYKNAVSVFIWTSL